MQNKSKRPLLAYALIAALLLFAVFYIAQPFLNKKPSSTTKQNSVTPQPTVQQIPVPDFNPDSAYLWVKQQVAFGPRVPNSAAHKKCAEWLANEFRRQGLVVIEQKFQARHFKGDMFDCVNIIAQYKPEAAKRLLFAAHWDSRFQADKDTKDINKPIDGADDGASGVAVLLEMARLLADNPVDVGVDFILFDAEDQGLDNGGSDTWCLGSQHWAKNLHRRGYSAYNAILLDMVGAKGARFYKEGVSREVAPQTVEKVWNLAHSLGYGEYFINENGGSITDDHLFVVRGTQIPMIDIINTPNGGDRPFGAYHHTHGDNLSIIDKNVLKAVGHTMTAVIYRTHNQVF